VKTFALFLSFLTLAAVTSAQAPRALSVYFVDVEGGQATLYVTPEHHSLLIDTGWPGNNSRDAERIAAAAKLAGLTRIDDVLITHFHTDHVGGVPQLVTKIPVGTFIDHGENRETTDAITQSGYEAYQKVLVAGKYRHIVAKPGDTIPLQGLTITAVSADGNLIQNPLPGAGAANAACKASDQRPADQTENARSLGVVIQFGKQRILDLGDLTWDKEMELMCPVNKLGKIDLLVVSHHGWNQSSSPALLNGIAPRVAIMDNGAKKGGSPSSWDIISKSPGLEDLWQLHYSEEGAEKHNVPADRIANIQGPDKGNYVKATVFADGKLEVLNSRTGKAKNYPAL